MNKEDFDRYLQEIGQLIVSNEEYTQDQWDAASVVVSFGQGVSSKTGYIYFNDDWAARTPRGNDDFMDKCEELWEFMHTRDGISWHQALIHITKPGPEINIKFEYDDPKQWSLKKASLDMQDYAESLRPPKSSG